jgi:hypothetical protein
MAVLRSFIRPNMGWSPFARSICSIHGCGFPTTIIDVTYLPQNGGHSFLARMVDRRFFHTQVLRLAPSSPSRLLFPSMTFGSLLPPVTSESILLSMMFRLLLPDYLDRSALLFGLLLPCQLGCSFLHIWGAPALSSRLLLRSLFRGLTHGVHEVRSIMQYVGLAKWDRREETSNVLYNY